MCGRPLQQLPHRHVSLHQLRRAAQHLRPFAVGKARPLQLVVQGYGKRPAYKGL